MAIGLSSHEEEIALAHRTRAIRARLRGDTVVAMDDFGAELTFFAPLETSTALVSTGKCVSG